MMNHTKGGDSLLDIHCHLMPNADDGADTLEEACMMARIAYDNGTDTIIVTPHSNIPGSFKNLYGSEFAEKFNVLRGAVTGQHIPVRLLLGMEVFAADDVLERIEDGDVLPLNASRYILLEFYRDDHPVRIESVLGRVSKRGLIPVLAHPERYGTVQRNPNIAAGWVQKGYLLQINKGSLFGTFGPHAQQTAHYLLDSHLAHVVASDAHSPYQRTPNLYDAYEYLCDHYTRSYADSLLIHTPKRIVNNQ